MITKALLEFLDPFETIGTGFFIPTGSAWGRFSGRICRWVAVTGGTKDWAIYIDEIGRTPAQISSNGSKVTKAEALTIVGADADAKEAYRS